VIEGDIEERMAGFAPSQRTGPSDLARDIMSQQIAGPSMEPTVPEPSPLAREIMSRDNDVLMSSLMGAVDVNPDEAAKASRIGLQFGVGQDIALRNMPEMEHREKMMQLRQMQLQQRDPILAEFMSDQTFARMAYDDLPNLSVIGRSFRFMRDIPTGISEGFTKAVSQAEMSQILERQRERGGYLEEYEKAALRSYQQELSELSKETGLAEAGAYLVSQQLTDWRIEDVERVVTGGVIGGGAGFVGGPLAPATVPAGIALGLKAGAATTMFERSRRMETAMLYGELEPELGHDMANKIAFGAGILNASLDVGSLGLITAPLRAPLKAAFGQAVKEAVRKRTVRDSFARFGLWYAGSVAAETGTETLQEMNNVLAMELGLYLQEKPLVLSTPEGRAEVADRLAATAVETALGMVTVGLPGPAVQFYSDVRGAAQAMNEHKKLENITKAVSESKLLPRNSAALESYIASTAEGSDASTVFIDAATANDILRQSGLTDVELDAALPGVRQQIETLQEKDIPLGGSDITIPMEQFTVRIAKTPLQEQLKQHARLSAGAPSFLEAQRIRAEMPQIRAEAEQILAMKQEADAAFVAEAQQVEDEAFEQVRPVLDAINIEKDIDKDMAARTIAKLRQAMVVVDAAEAGMTPAQYQRERGVPLQVRGVQGEIAPTGPLEQADQFDQAGQRRTDTPQFRDYFGESKVVDEQGQPRVVYHGTNKLFDIFKVDPLAWFGDAFLASQFVAGGRMRYTDKARKGSMVYPVYLSIQRPLMLRRGDRGLSMAPTDMVSLAEVLKIAGLPNDEAALRAIAQRQLDTKEAGVSKEIADPVGYLAAKYLEDARLYNILDNKSLIETFKNAGYDGIGISEDGSDTWAVFSPEQVKSVNNRGTWDKTSPRMMEQAATLDADYLAAAERGDMATAQRMVDEAASAQGYTVEAFHGTPEGGFTEFNESPSGLFFTNKPSVAQGYTYFRNPWLSPSNNAAVYRTRLRMQNPLVIDAGGARNNNIPFPGREYQRTVFGRLPEGAVSVEEAARLAFESGYDGIIINNVMDSVSVEDKTRSTVYVVPAKEQAKLADPITYDEQGNIVPLSRRFDITSPKLFEQAAAAPRLMAVHNLSADNLAFAERMGGLAVPSIGVVTEQAGGVEGFGEITLIGSREMADPSTSRVFEADAYSARFPQPEWPKVPVAKADKFVQRLREVSKKYDDSSIVDVTFDGMVNNPDASKISNYWMSSSAAMALFLRDKGIEIEPRMRVPSTLSGLDWNEIDALRPVYNAVDQNQSYDDMEASPEYAALQEAYANAIRAKYAPIADEMPAGRVEKYATEFGPKTMSRLQRDMQQTDRNKVSYSETRDALETAIQPYQAEFKTWVDSTIREQFGAPFIRDGKLKKPYTLGNIVDAMTSAKVKGEEKGMTFGAGAARAAASEEFVDLEQMREAASTAIVDPEKYAEESKKSAVLLEAYRNAMADYSTLFNWRGQIDTWAALDGSMRAIARYGNRKRKSEKAMRDALRREGFDVSKMPPELIDQAIEAASALYTAPVPYFEAKPQRAVGLGEFKGAVIPSNASAETRSILERNNIPFVEYGSEQTRTADVRKFVDLLERGGKGVFFQAAAGPARGGFDPRTLNILIGEGGDVSTLAHELIHLRVAEYLRMARSATPPARVIQDLDTLFVFIGVEGSTFQERLDNYERMTIEQRRPLEEKATYNFEIYLYEGKAPSVELRGVFDRLAAWMRRVYESIRVDLNAIYRREFGTDLPILTPEVRSVFDRMLASEEQIKRQEAISGMKGLFQTQAESGMADAEWAAYQAMQQEATDAAVTDLNTASMRQLQWLGNARARILRDLQKKHEAKRKEVTAEVAATVKVEPVYRAMTYLRYGRFVDTDGAEVEVEGTHRLDIEKVRAMYAGMPSAESVEPIRATGMAVPANVRPDITPLGTGKYGMLGRDGLDPDVVAETFGYGSGDEMVRALLAAKPMKEAVAERTDAEMLRRFGEMNTPAALEAEVQKALHNEARARFVAVELRHIAKATQPVRVMLEAAKQVAADMISDMTVREVRPGEFVAAESRAARDADRIQRTYGITEPVEELVQRYGADRQQALIRAKRAQLYQNQLAAEALRVKEYVDKQVKYLRGVMRDSNVKRMGAAAADQIAGLLERFEVAQVSLKRLDERRTMAKYLADLEAAGVVPDIAEEITDEARRVNYKELKVSEFRDLVDAVRQIEHIGKNEQKMRLAEERAAFEEVRDEIVTRIRAVGKVRELQIDPRTPLTGIGRTAAFLRGFAAQHLKAASIARILDGGKEDGPLWNTIIRTANDASDMETRMRAEASLKLGEILKPVFALGNMGGKGMFFPSIGRSLNREARISIALNLGNDGNRQRLLDGEGWTMEKLQPVLESLTEAEWMAVQQVWDFIDGYRPEIAAKERRLYGKEPTWVTPVPFTVRTSDGKEVALQGGYYPVKYDPVASDRVATVDAAEDAKRELQGAYTAATTRRSFVKARAKEVRDRPLLYTLDAAFSGVNDVIHDLSWHEWLISTNRLLRDTQFANAVRETRGPEFLKQLRDWTKDNATGARGQQVAGEAVLSWLRQGISASGLGFNVVSAAMQVTGFNQSIVRIGAKYVGQGIVQFSTSPFESSKMVAEKSSFMAERGRTQFREINEIKNRVRGQTEVARRVTAGTYFLMMNMQRSVDIPTWLGAYQKALDAGKDDARAVALADQAVRDSQGSGLVSDLAAVERGGPAMKLFTVFYSYMNTVYNMTAVQTMTARSKGKLAADYAMLLVVPVVLGYAIKSVIQPDAGEDELDPEALARKLAAEELSYLMGTMVIVREFGGAAQLMTGAEGARMGYGGPAGLRAVGEVYGLATQAGQLEFDRAFRRAAINTLGAFTGLPSAQVNRTIDGIEALVEGEVTGPTAVLAPLTGVQR
jgi:hypothetical protein